MAANSVLAMRKLETYTKSGVESCYDENTDVEEAVRALYNGSYRIDKK